MGQKTILIVVNGTHLGEDMAEIFEFGGYATQRAVDGHFAIQFLEATPMQPDLIICENERHTVQLIEWVRASRPDMPFVIISARFNTPEYADFENLSFLIVPFTPTEMLNAIRAILDKAP